MAAGELDSVTEIRRAFYRMVGMVEGDSSLTLRGEAAGDVADEALTYGARAAQLWLIDHGLDSWWRKRSGALPAWSGSEAADGGRYVELSAVAPDFLRFWGDPQRTDQSALSEADGRPWGREAREERSRTTGNFYYVRGERLWITRGAAPPAPLYLEYYARHPAITAATPAADIDFPVDARRLVVAEAAAAAMDESWLPDDALRPKIERALFNARQRARRVARRRRQPPGFQAPTVWGTHW